MEVPRAVVALTKTVAALSLSSRSGGSEPSNGPSLGGSGLTAVGDVGDVGGTTGLVGAASGAGTAGFCAATASACAGGGATGRSRRPHNANATPAGTRQNSATAAPITITISPAG